jgi:hypothetical protein
VILGRKPKKSQARQRLERLSDSDILNWCDQAGSGVAKGLDDYRRLKMSESLVEARMALEILLDAVDLLEERATGAGRT